MRLADRVNSLPSRFACPPLPVPVFRPDGRQGRLMLAWHNFARHMTNEGWQLQDGLREAGYELWGRHYENDEVDVPFILGRTQPGTIIVQDKREWDPTKPGCFDRHAAFERVESLAAHDGIFRVAITKDAHQDPEYHWLHHAEIAPHAWIVYYHPDIVCHLSPWIRREHVLRTYHSVDPREVPMEWPENRRGCLLSGSLSPYFYPLRTRLAQAAIPGVTLLPHPGYNDAGWQTPQFLQTLVRFRVAICTASIFGYALRKCIEATACGCRVITDLPEDEVLPGIDGNLVRIEADATADEVGDLAGRLAEEYDVERQRGWAEAAIEFYDYRRQGRDLAARIEEMRNGIGIA